eukprot:CAMPEP_0201528236 /NCGR_PEP_ID=MMETSP0161_2-20130828/37746_1 /ASSEMBLY_ACC=CAM_ASM_000251 /TAXON_ID=180227 /ORGANISM="Neoparamoeba aestuarina, Strain SoJaBio B1-5/56/2" /LENGTH=198 /DNA_ID=CAMNT_0047929435 /DNA_START=6 /DNA_END=602 /DNA_ORIENTATION=-
MLSSPLFFFIVVAFAVVDPVKGFWFDLSGGEEKCFYEDMVQDIMAGDTNGNFPFAVRVEDPQKSILWSTQMGRGASFGVKADQPGRYAVCFVDMSGVGGLAELSLTSGAAAQDYSDIAKKDHLEPLALSLRKSTDIIQNINNKLHTIDQRRERHESTVVDTHGALGLTSSITILIVILLGVLQIYALRSFLRKKKVID